MQFRSLTAAYSHAVAGLIRDCASTKALETLTNVIEPQYRALRDMFIYMVPDANDKERPVMLRLLTTMADAYDRAHDEAFYRLTQI